MCDSIIGLVRIYVVISQIMLHSFQFFRPADKHNSEELLALYTSACLLIAELESAQKFSGLVSYGTYWIFQGILLASCCLLRLLKTPLAGFDTSDGQRFFLKSLELMKNYSLTDNDHAARVSISLKALWNSDRVFKNVDGTWNSELRVRSRFGISVVFDVMWWSHEEFAGQNNPYPRKESVPTGQYNVLSHLSLLYTSSLSVVQTLSYAMFIAYFQGVLMERFPQVHTHIPIQLPPSTLRKKHCQLVWISWILMSLVTRRLLLWISR